MAAPPRREREAERGRKEVEGEEAAGALQCRHFEREKEGEERCHFGRERERGRGGTGGGEGGDEKHRERRRRVFYRNSEPDDVAGLRCRRIT